MHFFIKNEQFQIIQKKFCMKKQLLLIFLLVSSTTFSQQNNPSPTLTKQDYLKKSKTQKTFAYVLLGVGTLTLAAAATGDISFDALPVLIIAGVGTIVMVPILFSASKRNKRKAISMSFKTQPVPQLQKTSLVNRQAPSLSLKINL